MSLKTMDDSNVEMEQALIEEYLNKQGYSLEKLKHLPQRVIKQLMKEATRYAVLKIGDVEAKAQFVNEIHGGTRSHN